MDRQGSPVRREGTSCTQLPPSLLALKVQSKCSPLALELRSGLVLPCMVLVEGGGSMVHLLAAWPGVPFAVTVPGMAGTGPRVPAVSVSPTAALALSTASTCMAPSPGTARCPSTVNLPWHGGPLQDSFQKLPAHPEPNSMVLVLCGAPLTPLPAPASPRCYAARVPIAVRFATVLGARGALGERIRPLGPPSPQAHRVDPFQLPLAGAQQDQGTRGEAGHIPCPSPPPYALIKGAAGAGGIQLHIMETEFLLKKEKALLCQNTQHSMHTLT